MPLHWPRDALSRLAALACAAALAACATSPSPEVELAPGARPNILLIVADDLGLADLGVFGSEIRTPNIDALAARGVILENFYTSVSCQPTRAMLMSGTDNHRAGVGRQGRAIPDRPGYEGYLNHRVLSLAERLQALDYHTYMSGKWHLGNEPGRRPSDRGFERSFTQLEGGGSHFADKLPYGPNVGLTYVDDGVEVESLPPDFYTSIAFTDALIERIDGGLGDGRPFFAYLAFTAPHWPIHALDDDMAKTRGRYDEGYDVIRERRFDRWKELGFADPAAEPPRLFADHRPWTSLSPEEQAIEARTMEAYAAMIERMDAEIGRLLDHLEAQGVLDDTLVMFISDNGAEAARNEGPRAFLSAYRETFDNSLENIGRPGSYRLLGEGWGEAGSAPYYLAKSSVAEGGVHAPAIVSAPKLGLAPGRSGAVVAVMDLAPTFLELAGAAPESLAEASADRVPVTGRSFAALLRGELDAGRGPADALGMEASGQRAVRRGDWKAIRLPEAGGGTGEWQLFNLAVDPGERNDLAAERPELLAELVAAWDAYAEENGVLVEE